MWTPDLTSSSLFLELSGVLFTAYVVLARRARQHVAERRQEPGLGEAHGFEGRIRLAPDPVQPSSLGREQGMGATLEPPRHPAPAPRRSLAELQELVARHGHGAVPALAEALRDPSPAIAEAAANYLGELGGPEALEALLAADSPVEDLGPGPAPRQSPGAAGSAPSAPAPSSGSWGGSQSLKEAFETPFQKPAGAPAAQEAPAEPAADEAVLPVLRLYEPLARHDFKALHRYCPHDPRDLDEEGLAEVLLRLVEDRSAKPALRYFALKNLVRFRHRDIAETLEDMLADPLPLVRYAAADALAVHGDESAVALLVEALEDSEGSVRASAAHTLAVLGGDMAIRPLLSLRDDPDEVVRYAARRALDAIGKRKKITRLLKQA